MEINRVVRRKELPFFQVENAVMDYAIFDDIYEKMVYLQLNRFANNKESCFPSHKTIAKTCYCSVSKVKMVLKSLEEKGLIETEENFRDDGGRASNTIYLLEIPNDLIQEDKYFYEKTPSHTVTTPQSSGDYPPSHDMTDPQSHGDYKQEQQKKNNIKKNNKKNNNKEKPKLEQKNVVVDLLSKHDISANQSTLDKWSSLADEKTIIQAIQETINREDIKNVVGYVTKILKAGYTPSKGTKQKGKLPVYIENQSNEVTKEKINPEQQKEVLDLLFKLGEIDQESYKKQLKELDIDSKDV